jgi:hypothetical protein
VSVVSQPCSRTALLPGCLASKFVRRGQTILLDQKPAHAQISDICVHLRVFRSFTSFNPYLNPCGADPVGGGHSNRPPGIVPVSPAIQSNEVFEDALVSTTLWDFPFFNPRYYPWIQVDQEAELRSFTDFDNVFQSDETQPTGFNAY